MTVDSDEMIKYHEGWFACSEYFGLGKRIVYKKSMPKSIKYNEENVFFF